MPTTHRLAFEDRMRARNLYILDGYCITIVARCFDLNVEEMRAELGGKHARREHKSRHNKGKYSVPPGYEHMFPDMCKEGLLQFMRESDFDYGIPLD